MNIKNVSSPIDIAITGMRAEWRRIGVFSNNIANAKTTRNAAGELKPYQRQNVILSTSADSLSGITSMEIVGDTSPFKRILDPWHPDADKDGYVTYPNIDLPKEMVNMLYASRAYQANVAVLKRYKDVVEVTLELLK